MWIVDSEIQEYDPKIKKLQQAHSADGVNVGGLDGLGWVAPPLMKSVDHEIEYIAALG